MTFWRLSGKDAEAFAKQVDESVPNTYAQAALQRGRMLCKQMADNGYSSVKPKKVSIIVKAFNYIKRHITE